MLSGPILLIGYDVESSGNPEVVREFLTRAEAIHRRFDAPCTLFLVGKVVENNSGDLEELIDRSDLFDIQQHTYSHTLLKTVCMDDGEGIKLVPSGSLEDIREEVRRTNELIRESFALECRGITGPWGYYRGLSDRPDILGILHENGMRFLRTWARNERDYQPVPFEIQPFWYGPQGFPDMLECPIHGWQDVHWRDVNGWASTDEYLEMLKETVDMVMENDLVWGYGTHDWSSMKEDPDMSVMVGLMEYALDSGLEIMDYLTFYSHCEDEREANTQ